MSMGRMLVSVFTSESRGGICMSGFPDARIISLFTQLMPYNRRNCGRASFGVTVKVQSIPQCPQFPQLFLAFECITRALWNSLLWWLLSVFLLPSLLDSSSSQYGPGYQLDDLGSILQIVQTDSRGLFVNGYRVAFLLRRKR